MIHRVSIVSVGALVLAAALGACTKSDEKASGPGASPPVPVSVAIARIEDAPVVIRTIGTVQAKATVMLRPQVEGRVAEVLAIEGADVHAGQVLLRIDGALYEATIREMEADLAQSRAMALDAHNLEERIRTAVESTAMSQRELEEIVAKTAAADADVASKEAQVETARLNLAYCSVTAPFAGRLGQFLVKPGAIVKRNETDLVEINQIDPIEVTLALPEQRLPAVRAAAAAGPLRMDVVPSGDTAGPISGELSFIDSKVDTNTGTIRLKGTFQNEARRLWPGRFANVTLFLGIEPGSILIPDGAIQTSQDGPAVYVVKADSTVELRQVKVRRALDGFTIIDEGIGVGDTVVTEGQLRLGPGTTVQIKTPGPPKG